MQTDISPLAVILASAGRKRTLATTFERQKCVALLEMPLEHLHSFALPTPKSGEIYVRIGRKFGVGRSSFPVVCSPSGVSRGKRGWLGESGRKRRHVGVGGWFSFIRSPRETPGKPRMAWGVRTKIDSNPDQNE